MLEIQNRLQLLSLVEAGTGLMSLLGSLDNEEYEKLRFWFTKESLADWTHPAAFEEYQGSIIHLACAIATAFGHPAVNVTVNGRQTLYTERCLLDRSKLLFPPLRRAESVLSVLPVLTEPITNALTYIQRYRKDSQQHPPNSGAIEIVIDDKRRDHLPHILVKIGNKYFDGDDLISPSGIAKARELTKIVEVASIDDNLIIEKRGEDRYLWVSVRLHPQLLYQRINQK